MDQNRAGSVNQSASRLPWYPPEAARSSLGKNADVATPIWAFAAATRLSAAAISGRRSRSSEGMATGIGGGATEMGARGIVTIAGGLPIRVAMACSNWERWMSISVDCARVVYSCVSA